MKKILVAVDGSKTSKKAILEAKELAKLTKAHVTLLNVVTDIMDNPQIMDRKLRVAIEDAFNKKGSLILEEALEIFGDYDGEVDVCLRCGDPAKNIIKKAEEDGYDLVIMGSRGLNPISRAMLGSISSKVLNHIDISVLIVK